jgi:hypothetical protein
MSIASGLLIDIEELSSINTEFLMCQIETDSDTYENASSTGESGSVGSASAQKAFRG